MIWRERYFWGHKVSEREIETRGEKTSSFYHHRDLRQFLNNGDGDDHVKEFFE